MIDIDGDRPGHLGQAPLGDATEDLHLAQAQVGMDEAERQGRVFVVLGFDEGDLVLIPVDHGLALQG